MARKLGRDLNSSLLTPSPGSLHSALPKGYGGWLYTGGGGMGGTLWLLPFPVSFPRTCFQVEGVENEPELGNLILPAALLVSPALT